MKDLLVIDADEIVYKVGFGSQRTEYYIKITEDNIQGPFNTKKLAIEWLGDGEAEEIYPEVVPLSQSKASANLKRTLATITNDVQATDHRLYLTGKDNFRFDVATILPYKGNRSNAAKPVHYSYIKELLVDEYGAITVDGMEADDAMSITSWQHQLNDTNWDVIISTQDKDLKMVPGRHYNPTKRESYVMGWQEARMCFYKQILTGDGTDNIPGIPGIGPATANKLLDSLLEDTSDKMYKTVLEAYKRAEQDPKVKAKMVGDVWGAERVEEVARLLWMQQSRDQMWTAEERYYQT